MDVGDARLGRDLVAMRDGGDGADLIVIRVGIGERCDAHERSVAIGMLAHLSDAAQDGAGCGSAHVEDVAADGVLARLIPCDEPPADIVGIDTGEATPKETKEGEDKPA